MLLGHGPHTRRESQLVAGDGEGVYTNCQGLPPVPSSFSLGWASCLVLGPGDRGLAPVALPPASVRSLLPHTLTEVLFGAGSRLSTGRP